MSNEPIAYFAKNKQGWWAETDKETGIPFYTHPVKEEHFEDEPQAEKLHEIMQSNTHPVKEQDESFDRTGSHMAKEYVSWTSCVACGQRVTGDSIHTCSPQLKEQDTDCQYCKQGCIRCDARKQLTDEDLMEIFYEMTALSKLHCEALTKAILRKAQENVK